MIGQIYSTSPNACMIRFSGGPWGGQSGLYDYDGDNLTIQTDKDGNQYDYNRVGPKHFGLSRIWIKGEFFKIDQTQYKL